MSTQTGFQRFAGTEGYIASSPLVDAVNCAIALERPLLIKGEPGTGKTVLARHVAAGLGLPLLTWHIKSTSKAVEGLYVSDTVQRLNDSRFGGGDVAEISRYIKLGPLGRSFAAEKRVVLLIDEVDKADLEFPNDLLHELDEMRFTIMETGEEVAARERPVVLITSNNEKELPDAPALGREHRPDGVAHPVPRSTAQEGAGRRGARVLRQARRPLPEQVERPGAALQPVGARKRRCSSNSFTA